MDFEGPDHEDLDNVRALNQAFIDALAGGAGLDGAEARLANEIRALGDLRRQRLANCPFLLFSMGHLYEADWPVDERQRDLLRAEEPTAGTRTKLVTAALGFLWQLARRNAYAARLVTGAPLAWCERLAERTFMELFAIGEQHPQLVTAMRSDDQPFWSKLIDAGTSDDGRVRRAARLSALQTILTASASKKLQQLPAAACSMPSPVSVRVSRGYNTRPDESAEHQKPPKDL